ncbi:putative uncharacterized protein DDB_G0290521 [Leptidea sinapis]|uniref:putative uncharacterized protein DDB_G0290521 n=1 Tax=Leptidea sinapis TaxID=189913 RepID=UPI0021C31DC6|nr:putative uncharacterized protein DDB_G0290521 [Leptidea sinapis]
MCISDTESSLNSEASGLSNYQKEMPKPKKSKNTSQQDLIDLASHYFKKPDDSESDIIAKGWALKLKRLSPDQRRYAKKIINDILFEDEMGSLSRNGIHILPASSPTYTYSYQSPASHQSPSPVPSPNIYHSTTTYQSPSPSGHHSTLTHQSPAPHQSPSPVPSPNLHHSIMTYQSPSPSGHHSTLTHQSPAPHQSPSPVPSPNALHSTTTYQSPSTVPSPNLHHSTMTYQSPSPSGHHSTLTYQSPAPHQSHSQVGKTPVHGTAKSLIIVPSQPMQAPSLSDEQPVLHIREPTTEEEESQTAAKFLQQFYSF